MNELAKGKYGECKGMSAEIRTVWGEPTPNMQHGSISNGLVMPTEIINKDNPNILHFIIFRHSSIGFP